MKEQITIQELSAYLPWEVKFSSWTLEYKNGIGYNSTKITKLVTIDTTNTWINGNPCIESRDIKLILYPLSSLTQEIEHKGERFVPIDYFIGEDVDLILNAIQISDMSYLPYNIIQKLLELNFDIFNLIPRGLAVNKLEL